MSSRPPRRDRGNTHPRLDRWNNPNLSVSTPSFPVLACGLLAFVPFLFSGFPALSPRQTPVLSSAHLASRFLLVVTQLAAPSFSVILCHPDGSGGISLPLFVLFCLLVFPYPRAAPDVPTEVFNHSNLLYTPD